MADLIDLDAFKATRNATHAGGLKFDDGDGTSGAMDGRVSRLEAHMEHVREDMRDIRRDLATLIDRTGDLPTKADLTIFNWQTAIMAVTLMALIVGGVIGGLSWIKPDPTPAAAPSPIVITLPTAAKK